MTKRIDWACCEKCGSDEITVETDIKEPGWVCDGDTLTCECGEKGWVSVDGEEIAIDYWHYNS